MSISDHWGEISLQQVKSRCIHHNSPERIVQNAPKAPASLGAGTADVLNEIPRTFPSSVDAILSNSLRGHAPKGDTEREEILPSDFHLSGRPIGATEFGAVEPVSSEDFFLCFSGMLFTSSFVSVCTECHKYEYMDFLCWMKDRWKIQIDGAVDL